MIKCLFSHHVSLFCTYPLSLFIFGSDPKDQATRTLRGVMRVGLVAKGLLLKGDLDLELVLLCKDKPTTNLLKKVSENLVTQLKVRTVLIFETDTEEYKQYLSQ